MKHSPKKFNIEYSATLDSAANDNNIKVWVAQPLNSVYQKIDSFLISPKPNKTYRDQQENKILYFEFKNQKKIDIRMETKATLWKGGINFNKKNITLPKTSNNLIRQHTKNENFLEQTTEVKRVTSKIIRNDNSILDKIESIFRFVAKNFHYRYPIKRRGVKHLNLNNLVGDCGEYSSLFVTICRILKIPAKNDTGFIIFPKRKKISEHGWVSVYLKPYGWVDFDVQYASIERNIEIGIKKYFGQRSDYRIIFTNGFNIPLKPKIPNSFQNDYWNKNGLPVTNNSVQTIQPIVFASRKKVVFEDSIKLV